MVCRRGYRRLHWTYRQVAECAYSLARELEARGIGRGDRVFLWGGDCPEWVAGFWATILRGAVAVPMDRGASVEFARRVSIQAGTRLCLCSRRQPPVDPSLPALAFEAPQYFTNMGLTAENVAARYSISREDQDAFSLRSHQKAAAAVESGLFDPEIVPLQVEIVSPGGNGSPTSRKAFTFQRDEGPRGDTSLAALAKLKPAFKEGGTVTAGSASQMSDGAAAVLVMSRARAETLGLKPLVRFISFAVGGVPPELMGIGPVEAIPKALNYAGLSLADIDLIELNEAFAAQSLAVMRELNLDPEIVNVNGGAIALGHPLGCTGAKLTTQIIHEMKRRGTQFGMVTMCIGGGMGAAGIFENIA